MLCQNCRCNAPTRYVEFYQNIGALFMRFSKSAKGNFCRHCIDSFFSKYTLTTATVGWFGMISFIVTPIFICINLYYYFSSWSLKAGNAAPPVPPEHPTLSLTPAVMAQLEPFRKEIEIRLNAGENLDRLTMNIAPRAKVSAFQVELFIDEMKR